MAYIKLKGIQNPLEISSEKARELDQVWKDKNIETDRKLVIKNTTFLKGEIKVISCVDEAKEVRKELNQKQEEFRQKQRDWVDYWLKAVKESPQHKADNQIEMFDIWWFVYMNVITREKLKKGERGLKYAPEDKWQEARKRAIDFFEENRDRVICDFRIWKDLFSDVKIDIEKKVPGMIQVEDLLQNRALAILTEATAQDIYMSREYLKNALEKEKELGVINIDDIPF